MGQKFVNNLELQLGANLTAGATVITFTSGSGGALDLITAESGDFYRLTIVNESGNRELVDVVAHAAGSDIATIERGKEGTTAVAVLTTDNHAIGCKPTAGMMELLWAAIAALQDPVEKFFTSGRKMWLYENVAPTGWTTVSAAGDRIIGVKGGSGAFDIAGGNIGGNWQQPNHAHGLNSHVHSLNNHTHVVPSHAHTVSEHNHKWYDNQAAGQNDRTWDSAGAYIDISDGAQKTMQAGPPLWVPSCISMFGGLTFPQDPSKPISDAWTSNDGTTTQERIATSTSESSENSGESSGNTADGAPEDTWRPAAAVGIVVEKQ